MCLSLLGIFLYYSSGVVGLSDTVFQILRDTIMGTCWVNHVTKKTFADREKVRVITKGHRKVKCELNQGLVMINLYVKFIVYSSKEKQVIALKVADRRRTRRVTTIGISQNLAEA